MDARGAAALRAGCALLRGAVDAHGARWRFMHVPLRGAVRTLAGKAGVAGAANGCGDAARFRNPGGVAVGPDGAVYVADTFNHTIRVIHAGVVTTLTGAAGERGATDGRGVAARFDHPLGVALRPDGVMYVADAGNHVVRVISMGGDVTTLVGAAGVEGAADGRALAARGASPWASTAPCTLLNSRTTLSASSPWAAT